MEDKNTQFNEAAPGVTGLDQAALGMVAGALGLAGKKIFDKLSPKKRAEATKKKLEKVIEPFDNKIEMLDNKIGDIEEAISDANEEKADTDNPTKKAQLAKKIEQLKPQLQKFQQAKRDVKEKKRKAKEKILGPALKSMAKKAKKEDAMREMKICSIVLGENYDKDFLNTPLDILNSKPSEIKEAYKKFIIDEDKHSGPCWKTHKMVGMKKKGNKMVPNCVPREDVNIDENRAIVYNPRMIRAFIKQVEKKFPKYKGEIQQADEPDEIVFPNDPKLIKFFKGAREVKFVLSDSVEIEEAKDKEAAFSGKDSDYKKLINDLKKAKIKFSDEDEMDGFKILKLKGSDFAIDKILNKYPDLQIDEAVKFWTVTITKKAGKLFKGQTVDVKARNSAEAIKKGIKQMKGNPALVPSDSVDAVLGESIVEDATKELADLVKGSTGFRFNMYKALQNIYAKASKSPNKTNLDKFAVNILRMETAERENAWEILSKADPKFMKKVYPDAKRGDYVTSIMYDRVYGQVPGFDESIEENLKKFMKGAKKKFTKFGEEKEFSFREYTETLDEKQIKGLQKKADETGIPYGILKKVFDRGMAAWKGGHRPGATPHQWAFARVNSFATKSKGTWGGADKDLAAKARSAMK